MTRLSGTKEISLFWNHGIRLCSLLVSLFYLPAFPSCSSHYRVMPAPKTNKPLSSKGASYPTGGLVLFEILRADWPSPWSPFQGGRGEAWCQPGSRDPPRTSSVWGGGGSLAFPDSGYPKVSNTGRRACKFCITRKTCIEVTDLLTKIICWERCLINTFTQ